MWKLDALLHLELTALSEASLSTEISVVVEASHLSKFLKSEELRRIFF